MRWKGMGRDEMGYDGRIWYRMGRDGKAWHGMGLHGTVLDDMQQVRYKKQLFFPVKDAGGGELGEGTRRPPCVPS